MPTLLYAWTIFLSAFLLFQVQPLIGKVILPWFGGSAAVWNACLLFFQMLLLLGYLYAHLTTRLLSPRRQALVHIFLLAASVALLPITPSATWMPTGGEDPALRIVGLLAVSIGLPYFMLSTTGPLVQAWFARERPGAVPYRLFALSNFGSMLGLLSYPVLFEPWLTVHDQSVGWSVAFGVFTLICGALACRRLAAEKSFSVPAETTAKVSPSAKTLTSWTLLAACPSVLLMAVTSYLTQYVAPIPLLWVLPLGLYLLSFILCFEGKAWYRRGWYLPLLVLGFGGISYVLLGTFTDSRVWAVVALFCGSLFVSCMVCHGELARLKPSPEWLTLFFLMVAFGGALGGVFVAFIAPHFFNGDYELPIVMTAIAVLVLTTLKQDASLLHRRIMDKVASLTAMGLIAVLVSTLGYGAVNLIGESKLMARNFYGTMRVYDNGADQGLQRTLVNGSIVHGEQYLVNERRRWPTTYYGASSGVGMAILASRTTGPQRVGVVGLGAATLAAYGRAGDYYRFYEINPLVVRVARSEFSFLADCPATVEIALGDARLLLEHEQAHRFDVLAVDAFSGDSIPVHLITREAFAVYFRQLRPGGILAIHISNRYLDLTPVVKLAADYYGKKARLVDSDISDDDETKSKGEYTSSWILISDQPEIFEAKEFGDTTEEIEPTPSFRAWTDDYSSIYAALR